MNSIQPYEPETLDYTFPTSLPATPSSMTRYRMQQIETDFATSTQFQNRRIVTIVVVALCVGLFVAHVLKHGINPVALVAAIIGGGVAYCVRNYTCPKHSGTKQIFKP